MASISKRGPYQWQAKIRRKGYPVQSKTFEMKFQAEAWARQIESDMDKGNFIARTEAENTTLSECLERYIREVSVLKKGGKQEAMKARNIFRHPISKLHMANVRSSDIATYRDVRLAEGKAPSTVQKELALLSHMFNVARREWGMESLNNPVQLVSKPKVNNQRDRRLVDDEEKRLLDACSAQFHNSNPWIKPLVILALETAMRKGELLGLMWNDIDFARKILRSKNKDPKGNDLRRYVPLSSRAISTLRELPRSVNGQVFQTSSNAVKLAFPRACKRACEHVFEHTAGKKKKCHCPGIEGLRFHDLRHEATSRLFEKGLNPMQVASITGHKTLQMLKRYTHLRAEDLVKLLN